MTTPTPRTDAERRRITAISAHVVIGMADKYGFIHVVPADFARELERELAEARASVENYATAAEELRQEVNNLRGQLAKAEADTRLLDGLERMMPPRTVMLSAPTVWGEITGPTAYVHVYESSDLKRGDYVVAKTIREAIAKAVEKWAR